MFLNLCDVLEQSLLDTIITFSSLGIITNFSSINILSDIDLVVYILSIMDFLKAYITTSFTYLSWGLINIVFSDRWTAQWGSPRQFLSGSWLCCWPPPCWCLSRGGPQSSLHWSHKPPVSLGDTSAAVDPDHDLAVGFVLDDDACLVPFGWVLSRLILDGHCCPNL